MGRQTCFLPRTPSNLVTPLHTRHIKFNRVSQDLDMAAHDSCWNYLLASGPCSWRSWPAVAWKPLLSPETRPTLAQKRSNHLRLKGQASMVEVKIRCANDVKTTWNFSQTSRSRNSIDRN